MRRTARTQESPEVCGLQVWQVHPGTTWLSQLQPKRHSSLKIAPESCDIISNHPQPRPRACHGGVRAAFGRLSYPVKSFQEREFRRCTPLGTFLYLADMHRAISMYYPVQCFSLPLRCCWADFLKYTEESLGADSFPSLENGDAAAMVHAGYVVLLYQTPLLRPKSASCSRRTRHQKCRGTDGTAAALAATQPTQVRNCVSSHGAHRDIHPHMHRWLLGWHWNYEISQLFLGSQSRGHSWWDYIIVLKQILSYHTCSAFSKAAYSYIVSRKHRVESTTRLLLRIYIKPLPSWHSTGSISSRSCFHRGLCHGRVPSMTAAPKSCSSYIRFL